MSTSGTYNFSNPKIQQIIDEAYERAGIPVTEITEQRIKTAIRSLNFVLQEWASRGNNLWTVKTGMIGLNPNQGAYKLLENGIDLKTVTVRTSSRILGGSAFEFGGGDASLAFDNNTRTACTQLKGIDGTIGYTWGSNQNFISMIGIQSNYTAQWTISCQYSNDGGTTWTEFLSISNTKFSSGQIMWFNVPIPASYNQIRIVNKGSSSGIPISQMKGLFTDYSYETFSKTGKTVPFNVQEIYFNNNLYDTVLSPISESEYNALPNKNQTGRPTQYWVDRQIEPIIHLWPTPTSYYNNLYFAYWKAMEDVGTMLNTADIPTRFVEPLTAGLAYRLSAKEGKEERVERLKQEANDTYTIAAMEDRERVPLRIYGDYLSGWGRP